MHKKYITLAAAAILSFFMTPQSIAQESTDITPTTTSSPSTNRGIGKQVRQAAKEQRTMNKQQRKEMKAAFNGKL